MAFDQQLTAEQLQAVEAERVCRFYRTGIKLTYEEQLKQLEQERTTVRVKGKKEMTSMGVGVDGTRFTHGTMNGYMNHKCRCDVCKDAATKRARAINRQKAYGRWENTFVDVAPVREHLKSLQAQGWGAKQIAKQSGVTTSVVSKILFGRAKSEMVQGKTTRPKHVTKILRENADKLLALEFSPLASSDGTLVAARGAHRRIQALMCLGYSLKYQAEYIGWTGGNFVQVLNRQRIDAATFKKIADMFADLEMTRRVETDHQGRSAVTRALNFAKKHKFVPPAAWDNIDLDDAPAQPEVDKAYVDEAKFDLVITGQKVELTKAEKVAAANFFRARGMSLNDIDELLGWNGYAHKMITRGLLAA